VKRASLLNLSALLLALASTIALAWPRAGERIVRSSARAASDNQTVVRVEIGPGAFAVADAEGHLVPLRDYKRIISTNLVTDRLLVELCEPTRILAVSSAAAERKRDGFRYQGMGTVDGFGPVEAIVAKQPDLVLTNSFGAPGSAERMREAGIQVFDLGELRGESSFARTALVLGELVGAPKRAQRLLAGFTTRLHKVSVSIPATARKRALYLSILGPDLQGGTRGTSYHDIMSAAGLVDVAAETYRDWPAYSAEQVLGLAPDLIITRAGYAANVCRFPGMDHLPACQAEGRIIELPGELLDEPGLAMLEAAELLFARAYGQ
jgi:iron complex transport system substrate-binding protein